RAGAPDAAVWPCPGSAHAAPLPWGERSRPCNGKEKRRPWGRRFTLRRPRGSARPAHRRGGARQHLRGQRTVLLQQADGVGQDRRRFALQRIRALLGGLLALGVLDHVTLVGGQAVVDLLRQRIQVQALLLADRLALLALLLLALAFCAAFGLVERQVLLRRFLAVAGHVLAPPLEFQVVGDAARMHGLQARQQRLEVAVAFVRDGGDARPRQGVVVRALAELVGVHAQRVGDVRHHALVLGAAALDAEKLGDGQLHMAEARAFGGRPAVEVDQVLHRALAEGGLADDQRAAVV